LTHYTKPTVAPSPERRRFLLAGLCGLLLLELPACRSWRGLATDGLSIPPEDLLPALADLPAAARLGRGYLATRPDEAARDRLVERLSAVVDTQPNADTPRPCADEVFHALEQAVRTDYAVERVVQVQGWILSVTEARLFALAALSL
jgi:hypothetical protein